MFAVIYRSLIKKGHEELYQNHWKTVATFFVQERGALGSTLHKSEDGLWIAYSRWPDKASRDASWPDINLNFPLSVQKAMQGLKDCQEVDSQLPEICMEVMEKI